MSIFLCRGIFNCYLYCSWQKRERIAICSCESVQMKQDHKGHKFALFSLHELKIHIINYLRCHKKQPNYVYVIYHGTTAYRVAFRISTLIAALMYSLVLCMQLYCELLCMKVRAWGGIYSNGRWPGIENNQYASY